MKIAIMQPTYLPWIGYFNLIKQSDVFVFLDTIQFEKRSWQQRNRILLNNDYKYLTIPVESKGKFHQCINEVNVDDKQKWREVHLKTIEHAYAKCEYYEIVISILRPLILDKKNEKIVDITIPIIKNISEKLNIRTKFLLSSNLNVSGKKSELLWQISKNLGASTYLSAAGSKEYIEFEGYFADRNIDVEYQDFALKAYPQGGVQRFMAYLSMIDLLCNVGFEDAKRYM